MKIDFDADSKALYIYFKDIEDGEVENTKEIANGVYLDINKNNIPVGIEILGVSKNLSHYDLANIFQMLLKLKYFYSISEVAHLLEVNDETIRRKVKSGEIKAKRMGGRAGYRISGSELERFLTGIK